MEGKRTTNKRLTELLAAVGVVASLAFVAVEIRQNTAAVRGATLQAVSQQQLDLSMAGLDNPELRAAFRAANGDTLTAEQGNLIGWFIAAKLRADENRFRQVQIGTLAPSSYAQLGGNGVYRFPYFAVWWAQNRYKFARDFRQLVDTEFLPLGTGARPAPSAGLPCGRRRQIKTSLSESR